MKEAFETWYLCAYSGAPDYESRDTQLVFEAFKEGWMGGANHGREVEQAMHQAPTMQGGLR